MPKAKKSELPQIPGDSGASTDRRVVEERTDWIEKFFQTAFELLDESMSLRGARDKNTYETTLAKAMYVVRLLTLRASHHSIGS